MQSVGCGGDLARVSQEKPMSEHQAYVKREMHLAIYGMLLVLSGLQPVEHLPWYEQLIVEAGADEIDPQ